MARLAGVDIPPQKRVVISLMYITGIGRTTAEKIAKAANINAETRTKDLSEEEVARLRQIIDRMSTSKEILIEGDLRRDVATNIKRLTEIGTYRGMRHRRGLPVPGNPPRPTAPSPPAPHHPAPAPNQPKPRNK